MSVIESRRQLSKKDYLSLNNADSSCLAAQEKFVDSFPRKFNFSRQRLHVDFSEDGRSNYRKV